jgi:hypothetical protein
MYRLQAYENGRNIHEENMWVTHVELYKTIGAAVDPAAIKGIQRVRYMWRI